MTVEIPLPDFCGHFASVGKRGDAFGNKRDGEHDGEHGGEHDVEHGREHGVEHDG